jgi:SAM-dependent methyltransferase
VTPPSISARLRDLIVDALSLDYISTSPKDGVETGNHYQSISLGSTTTIGFRETRANFLEQIAFEGKKVVDLGSNLGELSRFARARGATIVDGYEYDPFFVEVAYALNALNKTTRVSFYERDLTDPTAYTEEYDVVLAFSVAHYVYDARVLEALERITREALVIETHRIENNLAERYIDPVTRLFPVYRILGYSEWSSAGPSEDQRAVIAFGKTEPLLTAALAEDAELSHAFGLRT